jgi:hypothetical protein
MSAAPDLSTFWLLFGRHGMTMTLEDLRDEFYPSLAIRTMQNKRGAGEFPAMTADVFDTRDVAAWWDAMRGR